jgi:hypothetical protein
MPSSAADSSSFTHRSRTGSRRFARCNDNGHYILAVRGLSPVVARHWPTGHDLHVYPALWPAVASAS